MNHRQLKVLLKHLYDSAVVRNAYMPMILWGEAGVGKSQAIKQATMDIFNIPPGNPSALEEHFRDVRVGQLDPADLIGVPRDRVVFPCPWCGVSGPRYADHEISQHVRIRHPDQVNGRANLQIVDDVHEYVHAHMPAAIEYRMVFTMPSWFPQATQRPGQKPGGFLFLDETNRGNKEVMQGIFQLLLDRRLHKSELPPGWVVIGAVNPSQSFRNAETKDEDASNEYRGVQNDMISRDKALRSRFMHIALVPSVADWLDYAADKGLSRLFRMAVAQHGMDLLGNLHARIPSTTLNPRTWVLYDKISRGLEGTDKKDILREVQLGMLGRAATSGVSVSRLLPVQPLHPDDVMDYIGDGSAAMLAQQRRLLQQKGGTQAQIAAVKSKEFDVSSPQRRRIIDICENIEKEYMKEVLALSIRNMMSFVERISQEENWGADPRAATQLRSFGNFTAIVMDMFYDAGMNDLIVNILQTHIKQNKEHIMSTVVCDPKHWNPIIGGAFAFARGENPDNPDDDVALKKRQEALKALEEFRKKMR